MSGVPPKSFIEVYDDYAAQMRSLVHPVDRHLHPITQAAKKHSASEMLSPAFLLCLQYTAEWLNHTPIPGQPQTMSDWADWICSPPIAHLWRARAWDTPTVPLVWWSSLCNASGIALRDRHQRHAQALRIFAQVWQDPYILRTSASPWVHLNTLCSIIEQDSYQRHFLIKRFARQTSVDRQDMEVLFRSGFVFDETDAQAIGRYATFASDALHAEYIAKGSFDMEGIAPPPPIHPHTLADYTQEVHPLSWDFGGHNTLAMSQAFSQSPVPESLWPHIAGMLLVGDHHHQHGYRSAALSLAQFEHTMNAVGFANPQLLNIHCGLLDQKMLWSERINSLRQELPPLGVVDDEPGLML